MEKLELKHLAGYLPYELKGYCTDDMQGQELMIGLNAEQVFTDKEPMDIMYFKPILRPLSDLAKEIEFNRVKFIPYIELAKKYAEMSGYNEYIRIFRNKCYCYSKSSEIEFRFNGRDFILNGKLVNAQNYLFLKLQEWHFDIHGLIENGLAIDINTL